MMSTPLWPVDPEKFKADIKFQSIKTNTFYINNVRVDVIEGNHPGTSTIYCISHDTVSIVYATDIELTGSWQNELHKKIEKCSLLICDGQYTDSEYEEKLGFGHSSWSMALELGSKSMAKNVRLFHHDPYRTDEEIIEYSKKFKSNAPNCAFARRGEIIAL